MNPLRKKGWLLALLFAASAARAAAPAPAGSDPVTEALAQARARHVPVLIDYSAPWCYSCYYMEKYVLTGPEWARAHREAVVVALDADSPVGAKWMAAWSVKAMPSYLLFNADGAELGRILGEQTRADFYAWLFATAGRDSLDAVKTRVTDGSKASVAAGREVLRAYHARYDAKGGLGWLQQLPEPVRQALAKDQASASWLARLELMRAASDKDAAGCASAAPKVFAGDLGCERPYELDRVMACVEPLPQPERRALLQPQAKPMNGLLDQRVLSKKRCADERSIVLSVADLQQELGDAAAEKKALDRSIDDLKHRLAGDLKKDRNMSDNLRVYLDRAGRVAELDQMLPLLIEAYPEDYVYAYRHAKSLAARGRHAEAVPLYEQAAAKTYGVNTLRIAELRAKSLQALGRGADARAVLAEALQANGPWFPEDAARLKALLDTLPPAAS
jgi:hypothetical protein